MFTGIIEELGTVLRLTELDGGTAVPGGPEQAGSARLTIGANSVTAEARHGDSISVNGVCLTVVECDAGSFTADVMAETLDRSSLGALRPSDPVNLERAATLATRIGGHLVQGHVDGVATIVGRESGTHWELVRLRLPAGLSRYVVVKGSIAVDGVSLTVASMEGDEFAVGLIPTTLNLTTLGSKGIGAPVNIEVDMVAKYIEKLLSAKGES